MHKKLGELTLEELEQELQKSRQLTMSRQEIQDIARKRKELEILIRRERSPRLQLFKRVGRQIGKDIGRVGRGGVEASRLVSQDIQERVKTRQLASKQMVRARPTRKTTRKKPVRKKVKRKTPVKRRRKRK